LDDPLPSTCTAACAVTLRRRWSGAEGSDRGGHLSLDSLAPLLEERRETRRRREGARTHHGL